MASLFDTPEEKRRRFARTLVDKAVHAVVADHDGEAVEVRAPRPGAGPEWGTRTSPLALPGVEAARIVLAQAANAERDAIAHARGKGHTWQEIGKALGAGFGRQAKNAGVTVRYAAWKYATYRTLPGEDIPWQASTTIDSFTWKCWTCTQHITERHPEYGSDAQTGHTAGCARGRRWA